MRSPASSPDTPTATGSSSASRLMVATRSRLIFPTSTIRTISRVSASVTRRPSRNSGSLPTRRIILSTCGPPPWTRTQRTPTLLSRSTSCASARSSASSIAAPPSFTTTERPWKRWM